MFVLFTDFADPYLGQLKAVLLQQAPGVPVVDLHTTLPPFRVKPAAYLLAACAPFFPMHSIFIAVVDPGVGTRRDAVILQADKRWYVGPDNGLLAIVANQAHQSRWWQITWRPPYLSTSFHGRDLFAPVAAQLAQGKEVPGLPLDFQGHPGSDWPTDWPRIIYRDHYGNCMTGLRAAQFTPGVQLIAAGRILPRATTFGVVAVGQAFCYENSVGLLEIAVNQGSAQEVLGLAVEDELLIQA